MFGKNAVTAPSYGDGYILRIKEIFPTIQGEGPRSGEPAVFVRLAGCNLRCWFCDTDFEGGEELSVGEVVTRVLAARASEHVGLVVLTGGEPLAQEVGPLCASLDNAGMYVQVETAGTCWPKSETFERAVNFGVVEIVCSPKTPKVHPKIEEYAKAWKYLVRANKSRYEDGLPIESTQRRGELARLFRPGDESDADIFLQPTMEYDSSGKIEDKEATRANMTEAVGSCQRFGYRLSLQLHKIIGLP
jgi:organic radical activating enzyme